MDFKEVYRIDQKFHCDPYGIYMFSGPEEDCSVTAFDTTDCSGLILTHLCSFLNGDIPLFLPEIKKVEDGTIFLENGEEIRVRGFGYLTSVKHLTDEEASKMQDEFLDWVVSKIDRSNELWGQTQDNLTDF